jgi:hypothetical protein
VSPPDSRSRIYPLIAAAWFGLALAAGASGRLSLLRPPAPQLVLAGLTGSLIAAALLSAGFRAWLSSIRLRRIVALHLFRFVGAYFLVLYTRGQLPYPFAVPGGWGDILIATSALLLVLFVPNLETRPGWLAAWNVVGFAELLFVVATAARLALADPDSMSALLRLPLSLLPTFLVPILIGSHVLLFWRLWPERAQRNQPAGQA